MQRLNEEVAAAEGHDGRRARAGAATRGAAGAAADARDRPGGAHGRRALVQGAREGRHRGAGRRCPRCRSRPSGKDVTKRDVLAAMLKDLAREERPGRAVGADASRTAGLRAAIGKLPPNVDDGSGGQLYALAAGGARDALILILAQRAGEWQPVGLVRR